MIMSLIPIICWSSLFLISCSPTRAFTFFHPMQSSGVGFGIGGQKQWAADKTRFFAINVPPHFGVSSWWMSAFGENWNGNRTVHGFVWGLTLHESGPPTLAWLPVESSRGIQSIPTVECQKCTLIKQVILFGNKISCNQKPYKIFLLQSNFLFWGVSSFPRQICLIFGSVLICSPMWFQKTMGCPGIAFLSKMQPCNLQPSGICSHPSPRDRSQQMPIDALKKFAASKHSECVLKGL